MQLFGSLLRWISARCDDESSNLTFQRWNAETNFSADEFDFGIINNLSSLAEWLRYEIPGELQQLLLDFTVCCLVERPCSLVDFAADYFAQLRQRRQQQQQQLATSVVVSAHGNGHGPESDDSMLTDDSDEPSPGKLLLFRLSVLPSFLLFFLHFYYIIYLFIYLSIFLSLNGKQSRRIFKFPLFPGIRQDSWEACQHSHEFWQGFSGTSIDPCEFLRTREGCWGFFDADKHFQIFNGILNNDSIFPR